MKRALILLGLLSFLFTANAYSADTKLSALAELAAQPADTDEFYVNNSGSSERIQYSNLIPDVENISTSLTSGSVIYSNGTNLTQDNARVYYEDGSFAVGSNAGMRNVIQAVKDESTTDVTTVKALTVARNINTTNNSWTGFAMQTLDATGDIFSGSRLMTQFTSHADNAVTGEMVFDTRLAGVRAERMRLTGTGLEISGDITASDGSKFGSGANYAEFASDGEVSLHGTARVKVPSWVDAGGIRAPGAKPATFVESGLAGAWEFSDEIEANQESISGVWKIPSDMEKAEGCTMKFNWYANGISPGNCEWQLEYLWVKLNQDETGAAQGTLTVTSTASATSNGMINAEVTGLDAPDADDSGLFFKITRLSGHANDTIGASTYIRGRAIFYTRNKLGTAT